MPVASTPAAATSVMKEWALLEMTGGEALARQLVREGITMLFGLPGVQLDHAFAGLYAERERIQFRGPRHEQTTTYMADAYARTRGEAGVAMVVPGPGVLNAGAGLATAYACSSPVLLIAGQIPSRHIGRGLGLLHEIPDQMAVLQSLTKWTGRATRPEEIPSLVRQAFTHMWRGRPRPVALEVPPDVLEPRAAVRLLDPDPGLRDRLRTTPDVGRVREAAALLSRAVRPLIYAGYGVVASGASAELAQLAERLQAPVVVSSNGKGALSDRHPLALNTLGGMALMAETDVVLAVGTRFMAGQDQAVKTGAKVILLNADPQDLTDPRRPTIAMETDARTGLEALSAELDTLPRRGAPWADVAGLKRRSREDAMSIHPQADFCRALRNAIPDDGILVSEMTQVGYVARAAYPVYEPRTFVHPGYQGTLGYGFPAALGVKAGLPDRAVVSITGDGGMGWGLSELATAKRYNLGLITVVFDDKAFGNVKRIQKEQFDGHLIGSELVNPDFVRLAESFGVHGLRVDTPDALEGALKEALQADAPCLIEVPVGEMDSMRTQLARREPVAQPS
ncbi:MAG: thiamine pyrophosphate-dependent enzyme [Clostridia bacterium]